MGVPKQPAPAPAGLGCSNFAATASASQQREETFETGGGFSRASSRSMIDMGFASPLEPPDEQSSGGSRGDAHPARVVLAPVVPVPGQPQPPPMMPPDHADVSSKPKSPLVQPTRTSEQIVPSGAAPTDEGGTAPPELERIERLRCIQSLKACEKFAAEKQSVKGRFSFDGTMFFANCVQTDEAHIYRVPVKTDLSDSGSVPLHPETELEAWECLIIRSASLSQLPNSHKIFRKRWDAVKKGIQVHTVCGLGGVGTVWGEKICVGIWHLGEKRSPSIIFDRTYTSGQAMFSPNSKWFS